MTNPSPRAPPQPPDLVKTEWDAIDKQDVLDYDADTETYLASFESDQEPVHEAIIAVIAVVAETPPLELPPLNSVIDPETVERLVGSGATGPASDDTHISFTFNDCHVTVHSSGVIAAQPHPRTHPADHGILSHTE